MKQSNIPYIYAIPYTPSTPKIEKYGFSSLYLYIYPIRVVRVVRVYIVYIARACARRKTV
jgi:hypothetical protein